MKKQEQKQTQAGEESIEDIKNGQIILYAAITNQKDLIRAEREFSGQLDKLRKLKDNPPPPFDAAKIGTGSPRRDNHL